MKILFVLEYYFPYIGGAEVLFKNLCEGLAGKGYRVTVVTSLLPGTTARESVNGVDILRVRVPVKGSRYWFTLLAIPSAVRLAGDCDVVHTTTYNGAFPAWLASRLKGKKCVITVLEIIGKGWKEMTGMNFFTAWLHRLLESLIISLPFERYVAISQYTAHCLTKAGLEGGKITVIYPGIDYTLFDPARVDRASVRKKLGIGDEFAYLYYGRPGISKGVEYLVKAVPIISEKIKDSRLILLLAHEPSDGYENVRKLIAGLGIHDNVIMVDPVPRDQLPTYIAAADCVVVPSLSEGFGFSAAEACAMGKPVVTTNVASLPEVVSGKYVLVQPKSPDEIANGVKAVYNDAVKHAEKKLFHWADCVEAYTHVYAGLSGRKGLNSNNRI